MVASTIVYHHPRLYQGPEGTTVILPSRYSGFVHLLMWIWLSTWAIVESSLLWSLYSIYKGATPNPVQSAGALIALLALFTLAGAFMAWRLVWVARGREILSFTPGRLLLKREPGIGRPEEYNRSMIRDLHVGTYDPEQIYPSWGRRFVGKGSAYIAFQYQGKACQIARGLTLPEAQYVLGLLEGVPVRP